MSWFKTDVEGKVMWESTNGERVKNTSENNQNMYGWRKTDVDGKIMWESPDGERRF